MSHDEHLPLEPPLICCACGQRGLPLDVRRMQDETGEVRAYCTDHRACQRRMGERVVEKVAKDPRLLDTLIERLESDDVVPLEEP